MNASRVWLLGAALAWIPCIAPAQVIRIAHTNTHRGFVQQLKLAAERCNVAISVEFVDTVVLNETILRRASANQCPDAVIISADNLAKEALAFSPISRELLSPDLSERTLALATQQGRIHGIPLICGNHLMLIYNKAKVAEPKRILEDFPAPTTEGRHAIVWNHAAMYYFWPFVLAFDGDPLGPDRLNMDNPGLRQALGAYV
ncbi:MAG: hypothetical protein QG602_4000 [Verrucomicrobiota bacterium]|nr:hypothetical protein [Verrucomicrobiota bacterium]